MKKLLLTLFALGMLFLTGCVKEYGFDTKNVGGGYIILDPFDVCGPSSSTIHSKSLGFNSGMKLSGATPHVDTLELKWRYWKSKESYKNGDKAILCKQTVSLIPPCRNPEYYSLYFCFNKTEVFMVYQIVWNGWKNTEFVLSNGCPIGYHEDLVGQLSYFKKNPDATSADFFNAMQKKYDYHPACRKNSSYFWLKWSPGEVIHYRKTNGVPVYWGEINKINDINFFSHHFMQYAFENVIKKIIAEPDITPKDFTVFVKNLGNENECVISNDLPAWKNITTVVINKKLLDPDRFLGKIDAPALKNQIAVIGSTPYKTFTVTFENVLSDEIKVDSKLIDRLKNQGYFSKMFVNKK